MSDEISGERAKEMAARFERMEPTASACLTPLGELVLAVLVPAAAAYLATIVAANWAIHHYGIVPVGFGFAPKQLGLNLEGVA